MNAGEWLQGDVLGDLMADWLEVDAGYADQLAEAAQKEFDRMVWKGLADALRAKASALRGGQQAS
jgi:hypothetical protein